MAPVFPKPAWSRQVRGRVLGMVLVAAVVLGVGLPVAHAFDPEERQAQQTADPGAPADPAAQPEPDPVAEVAEAQAQAARAEAELGRYEEQVAGIRATQNSEAAANGETWTSPEQELALQATGRRLAEANADAAASLQEATEAVGPPSLASDGPPSVLPLTDSDDAPSDRSPLQSDGPPSVLPQTPPTPAEAVAELQQDAIGRAERQETATHRNSQAGWDERDDLDQLGDDVQSLSNDDEARGWFQAHAEVATAMRESGDPEAQRSGEELIQGAAGVYVGQAASTADGIERLIADAAVKERQALAELEALHEAVLVTGEQDEAAVARAELRLADARADRIGGDRLMTSIGHAVKATALSALHVLDPEGAGELLRASEVPDEVLFGLRTRIDPAAVEQGVEYLYGSAEDDLEAPAMLTHRKRRVAEAEMAQFDPSLDAAQRQAARTLRDWARAGMVSKVDDMALLPETTRAAEAAFQHLVAEGLVAADGVALEDLPLERREELVSQWAAEAVAADEALTQARESRVAGSLVGPVSFTAATQVEGEGFENLYVEADIPAGAIIVDGVPSERPREPSSIPLGDLAYAGEDALVHGGVLADALEAGQQVYVTVRAYKHIHSQGVTCMAPTAEAALRTRDATGEATAPVRISPNSVATTPSTAQLTLTIPDVAAQHATGSLMDTLDSGLVALYEVDPSGKACESADTPTIQDPSTDDERQVSL